MSAIQQNLFLKVGDHQWPVLSLQDASEKFCAVRDRMLVGASQMPQATLIDEQGKQHFYISYNGRVWSGHAHDWHSDAKPVYDNRISAMPEVQTV